MGRVLPLPATRTTGRVADASDTAAVEVVLSRREPIADRCRALRRLGLIPEAPFVSSQYRLCPAEIPPQRLLR